MYKYLYAVVLSILSVHAFAATIRGKVTDSKNSNPLTGVVVSVTGGKGAITDFDGNYEIGGIDAGTYEISFTYATYITYKQSITVTAKETVDLDMKLMPETTELKDQVVKAARITNTEASVITEIKNSTAIASGTSAAQISKTLDRNAAEVVKRIPGVTIQDNRFIVVRGLADRYNSVWLNDASTPSSEADKRAFSFDIIPAGLIDRVMIFKTPSPELPGDFAGGMVKIYTTAIADKNQVTLSGSVSSREFTTGTQFNYEPVSKTDWLGYDDGKRNVPANVPGFISSKDPNYKKEIGNWSKAFGNDWGTQSMNAAPDMRVSLSASGVKTFWDKLKVGNTLGVSYTNSYTNFKVEREDYLGDAKDFHFIDQRSEHNINGSIMDNLGVSVGNSKIEFKNLYNQSASSLVTFRNSVRDTMVNAGDEKSYLIQYESRATYATQLTGTHKNKKDTRRYTWTAGYTDMFRNMPNRRIIKYNKGQEDPDSAYKTSALVSILNGGRLYSTLFEKTYSFNHQFTQKVKVKDYSFDINVGNYAEYKNRAFNIRELGYSLVNKSKYSKLLFLPYDRIYADSNVDGTARFKINEITNAYDKYFGGNRLLASFISLKAPIGKNITVAGGVRNEYNQQLLTNYISTDTINLDLKTNFLLPSVNVSYNFSEKALVRAAYGKTVNRPEFREAAATVYYDFDALANIKGALYPSGATGVGVGDTLKVSQIHNFDVRYELYPSPSEMIHIGAFYKTFSDPIQRVMPYDAVRGDNLTFTYVNADEAYCYGVELDVRKNLAFIDDWFGTGIAEDVSFVGNLALTKSELTIDSNRVKSAIPKTPIQGQSPYVVNAGLYYQSPKTSFDGSILYNVSGPKVYAIGAMLVGAESLGEMPFASLDFAASKLLYKHVVLNVGIQNILGSQMRFVRDIDGNNKFDDKDTRFRSFFPGRYYSVGLKIKF